MAKAQGPGVEAGGSPVGRRRRRLGKAREACKLQANQDSRKYCRLDARADRIFRGAPKLVD